MKTRKKELEVDTIGSEEPLTSEEQKVISEFLSKNKLAEKKQTKRRTRLADKQKNVRE